MTDTRFRCSHSVHPQMTIRLEHVTQTRETTMDAMWREFQLVLTTYTSYTSEFYEDYIKLRQRNAIHTQLSEKHCREIAKCNEMITDYRLEIGSKNNLHSQNMSHLLEVKRQLQQEYTRLKTNVKHNQSVDKVNIRELVTAAESAKKSLMQLKEKGSVLVNLAKICEKYEGDDQKFTISQRTTEKPVIPSIDSHFQQDTYANLAQLGPFWERFNKVRLDCACLAEEKAQLLQERVQLKIKLKTYLVEMSMDNSTGNTQLRMGDQQRPKSMTVHKVPYGGQEHPRTVSSHTEHKYRRPITAIEGNLSVAVRSRKLADKIK